MVSNDKLDNICEALSEIKELQDLLTNSSTKYFGNLLGKIAGVDTIPLLLLRKSGPLTHKVFIVNEKTGKRESFESSYFRLDSINKESRRAWVSVLCPLDFKGDPTNAVQDVIKLIKTSTIIEVDLNLIFAVQLVDTELLKRKIIVEPKW
ncbi:CotY/CotZ family spore coat protein [Bacillus sp. S/N-304-OC-R1]|uniref:CotY/CotZ family spore coat protein n=1 Tax=Bacillus sp. S/N-304-OC-R1 TaxID=2758034 RepID=UPI001C8D2C2E|nr:CotY/CotZ family spore coat protein [Bacillus sp. S/N-304-OC-R1]MBY0121271.1 hypothetical protein [Bacillus sp. S/N-304-OC-R1]